MTLTGLLVLVLIIAVIGFAVWIITTKIPMDDSFKQLITVVVVIFIIFFIIALLTGHVTLSSLLPGVKGV